MRVIINENKINSSIESFLRKTYPNINDVQFENIRTGSWEDGKLNTRENPHIKVIFEPNSVPDTNIGRMNFRKQIINDIRTMFGVDSRISIFQIKIEIEEI